LQIDECPEVDQEEVTTVSAETETEMAENPTEEPTTTTTTVNPSTES
jgi:hypothetical protein